LCSCLDVQCNNFMTLEVSLNENYINNSIYDVFYDIFMIFLCFIYIFFLMILVFDVFLMIVYVF
jgi:hypothetical protein